jgi:hypothetical protein
VTIWSGTWNVGAKEPFEGGCMRTLFVRCFFLLCTRMVCACIVHAHTWNVNVACVRMCALCVGGWVGGGAALSVCVWGGGRGKAWCVCVCVWVWVGVHQTRCLWAL